MSKKSLFILPALAFMLMLAFFISKESTQVWEDSNHPYEIGGITDAQETGNSEIYWFKQIPSGVEYSYVIGEKQKWAYAGLRVAFTDLDDPSQCVDWSHLDSLSMKIKSKHNKGFTLQVRTFANDLAPTEESRVLYQILLSDTSYTHFSLGLDDFYIPEWYKLTHKLPASGADMSLHCVQSIQLLSSNYIARNQMDTVSWTEVYLHQNRTWPIPLVLGFILSTFIFMLFGYIKAKTWRKAVQTNILNQFEATPETKIRDTEWEAIRNYFAANYSESDFKLEAVSKEIGITQKRLTLRVRNQLNKSPREYLNELRLKEGARLLLETDLAINKIAFDIGYNSAAHFNRQFKLKYELTPKVYRDTPKEEGT